MSNVIDQYNVYALDDMSMDSAAADVSVEVYCTNNTGFNVHTLLSSNITITEPNKPSMVNNNVFIIDKKYTIRGMASADQFINNIDIASRNNKVISKEFITLKDSIIKQKLRSPFSSVYVVILRTEIKATSITNIGMYIPYIDMFIYSGAFQPNLNHPNSVIQTTINSSSTKTGASYEIVDNSNHCEARYINIATSAHKVPIVQDVTRAEGLYLYIVDSTGVTTDFMSIEESDTANITHKTRESCFERGNPTYKQKLAAIEAENRILEEQKRFKEDLHKQKMAEIEAQKKAIEEKHRQDLNRTQITLDAQLKLHQSKIKQEEKMATLKEQIINDIHSHKQQTEIIKLMPIIVSAIIGIGALLFKFPLTLKT